MSVKQCSKCNKDFECTSTGTGCWCQQYNIEEQVLSILRSNYADCLCPNCLKGYAIKTTSTNNITGTEE